MNCVKNLPSIRVSDLKLLRLPISPYLQGTNGVEPKLSSFVWGLKAQTRTNHSKFWSQNLQQNFLWFMGSKKNDRINVELYKCPQILMTLTRLTHTGHIKPLIYCHCKVEAELNQLAQFLHDAFLTSPQLSFNNNWLSESCTLTSRSCPLLVESPFNLWFNFDIIALQFSTALFYWFEWEPMNRKGF